MPPAPDRLIAALADRYLVTDVLGAGGMATVYAARDLRHERDVAIKVLDDALSASLGADRFLSEIRITAGLQHPHIVPVFDSGIADGLLYFVMPRIDGETLRAHLNTTGPLPVAEALRIVRELADALAYAHERGILHRDLKPENVLLSSGHALLADFGIAASTAVPADQRLTQTGTALGTPAYMSPEQATGDRQLGPPADVYALGTILFELLTGTPPFTGLTFESMLVQRFTQDAPRASTRRADTPPHCDTAIAKALARDPADRFQQVAEFSAALHHAAPSRTDDGPSLAVLPFVNLSTDAENGYFADGLTEEVILMLSTLSALRVRSRTSVAAYRERTAPPAEIARTLGVTHLLEGSVRKAGPRVRIAVSLLEARSDRALWAENFDGTLDDVFAMQDRVATAIVNALQLRLSPKEQALLLEHPIANAAAYDEYLRAREGLNAFTVSGLQRAMHHLARAAQLEPDNVYVLRGLGRACWAAVNHGVSDDVTQLDEALRYADAIERLRPDSPYIAELRGLVAFAKGDAELGLRNLAVAHEAMPTDEDVGVWYAIQLMFTGQVDAADAVAREVTRLHDSGFTKLVDVVTDLFRGRPQRVIERHDLVLENCPVLAFVGFQMMAALAVGDGAHVQRMFERTRNLPADPLVELFRFLACATQRDAPGAAAALTPEVAAVLWNDFQYAELVAEGFAVLGDEVNIAKWLGRSVDLGMAYVACTASTHAAWQPWLDHPAVAPLMARCRDQLVRYAAIPLAPRVVRGLGAG
jgi:eukaryotic-like serine/threonine-protein kinase